MPTSDSSADPYLRVRDLNKYFGNFPALKNISLDIFPGEFVCFLGPSGCGKTTLLRAIAGLDIQTSGMVEQGGVDISALPPSERDFGIVFQSYALFPNLTVRKNVAYGLENRKTPNTEIQSRVKELLELVGLPEQGDKYPAQLSGGQQQRIALARALATSPGLLLLDEPLSALDAKVRVHLRHEIKQLHTRLGLTTVMVTHDQEEALTMADRIVVMDNGVIEQTGTPMEIYRQPGTTFVADFIGTMNFLEGVMDGDNRVQIGDLTLHVEVEGLMSGSDVTVAVRPEDILLITDEIDDTNTFMARVDEIEFLGSFVRAELSAPQMEGQRLRADISINRVKRYNLEPGEDYKVTLPANCLRIYPAKEA